MAYNIVGIKWRNYVGHRHGTPIEPIVEQASQSSDIKPTIKSLLFDHKCNQVLTKYNGELFICEGTDSVKQSYVYTKVDYHPYEHLV